MTTKENDPFFRSPALTEADKKLADANSSKPVYLLSVEDLDLKKTKRYLLTAFDNKQPSTLEFKGYEISKTTDTSVFKTWSDVLKYASEKNLKLVNLFVPWHRVNNVQNITFNNKQ